MSFFLSCRAVSHSFHTQSGSHTGTRQLPAAAGTGLGETTLLWLLRGRCPSLPHKHWGTALPKRCQPPQDKGRTRGRRNTAAPCCPCPLAGHPRDSATTLGGSEGPEGARRCPGTEMSSVGRQLVLAGEQGLEEAGLLCSPSPSCESQAHMPVVVLNYMQLIKGRSSAVLGGSVFCSSCG